MTRLCNSLAEVHAAYVELFRIKRHLANNGHRFCGLFAVEPEFLDIPTDKTTELVTSSGSEGGWLHFFRSGGASIMSGSYETAAARPLGLEYGGGGYVAAVDGQKVAPAVATSALNADDYVIQGYAVRWNTLINTSPTAWVAPYAIRDLSKGVKRLHFDHDESRTMGIDTFIVSVVLTPRL